MKTVIRYLAILALLVAVLSGSIAVTLSQGPVVNPGNGHYYALFVSEGISWPDAHRQASETSLNDCQVYLATTTSAQESDFLIDQFGGAFSLGEFWLGGYQDPGVGPASFGWQWVTAEPWDYTNWAPGEPNDAFGYASEQHLGIHEDGVWNDEANLGNIRGYIVECDPWGQVQIDIKPGSDPNSINLRSRGVVPVALLSSDDFDASTVDPATVDFAGAPPVRWAMEDVDSDGDLDLLFHFKTQELNLDSSSIEATLTGETFEGLPIQGTDRVNIVPKGK